MNWADRILLALGISWAFALSLGTLEAVWLTGEFDPSALLNPAILLMVVVVSTECGVAMSPVAVWAVRTGPKNLARYCPVLWTALAAYIILVLPRTRVGGLYGLFAAAAAGTLLIGLVPRR